MRGHYSRVAGRVAAVCYTRCVRASRAKIFLPLLGSLLTLQVGAQAPAGRSLYIPYSDARPILESLEDILPAELKNLPAEQRPAAWPNFVKKRDAEIRARLRQGDEDSIVNLLFFGTSFTRQRRVTTEDLAQLSRSGRVRAEQMGAVIQARAGDLVQALAAPGNKEAETTLVSANERLAFAQQVVSRNGHDLATTAGRQRARQFLYTSVARVLNEQAGWAATLEEARRLGNRTEEFAERSRLYRDRGLSLDASLRPNFAIEQTLAELKRRGLLVPGSVKRVAVIGPGLDFVDKTSGYDFYPEQTIQPFAVMDSLLRLGLADAKALEVTTLDLSPRVNAHVRRMRQRAASGATYTVQLPRETGAGWREEFVAYWQKFGEQIGVEAKAAALPEGVEGLAIRAMRIRPRTVLRVRAADLNVVLQRLDGAGYDLIVATNILVYYDLFEQCLALKNVERMLRPGGLLLSNNALLELPSSSVRSVGYLTTVYSSRADDGDHIVWYQKGRD